MRCIAVAGEGVHGRGPRGDGGSSAGLRTAARSVRSKTPVSGATRGKSPSAAFARAAAYLCTARDALLEQKRRFALPSVHRMLEELRTIVAWAEPTESVVRTNHASNYLPIGGTFPRDRERILALVDRALAGEVPLRPEWREGCKSTALAGGLVFAGPPRSSRNPNLPTQRCQRQNARPVHHRILRTKVRLVPPWDGRPLLEVSNGGTQGTLACFHLYGE